MSANINKPLSKTQLNERVSFGVALLSQQIWCWGRDILRAQGNWLIEQGFEVIKAPEELERVKNIYSLKISKEQHIMLRGFGIILTDERYGSIFVPRYEFLPKYAPSSKLNTLPWSTDYLPEFAPPKDIEKQYCSIMFGELIDWIITYEQNLIANLGIDFRNTIVEEWNNGKRQIIASDNIISEWEKLRNDVEEIMQL
tara:strand:+ start:105 stop:698 length:594 start_codon:yes stop_codon:yes gene_type:complete